jgi:hypothetical protein
MTPTEQGRSQDAPGPNTSPLVTVARYAALFDPAQLAASPAAPPATPARPEEIVVHLLGAPGAQKIRYGLYDLPTSSPAAVYSNRSRTRIAVLFIAPDRCMKRDGNGGAVGG